MPVGTRTFWHSFRRYPELWILLSLDLVLFPLRHSIAGNGQLALSEIGTIAVIQPLFLAVLGLGILLIPGAALVTIFGVEGPWWERLALALVGSLASVGLVSQTAAWLHVNIDFVLWGFCALSGCLVAAALARILFIPAPMPDQEQSSPAPVWMLLILVVMVLIAVVFALNAPLDGDHADALAYIQNIRYDAHMLVEEPKWNAGFPVSPRFYLDTWLIDQAMMARLTGQDPVDQSQVLRLPMLLLTLAALYGFARRVTRQKRAAVIATIIWILYLITSNRGTVAGYETIVRPDLDKVVAGFIILPLTLGIIQTIFDGGRRRDWFWLGVCTLAAMLTHPLAVGLIGLSVAGFGLGELLVHRSKRTVGRLALVASILIVGLLPSLLIVIVTSTRDTEAALATTITDTRDPSMSRALRGTLRQERILILDDGSYIMHPRLILQSFYIPALLGLPLLLWLGRRSRGARMLLGILAVISCLVLFPPTAVLLGQFTTPWLLYRVHWSIGMAAIVTLGWGTAWLYNRAEMKNSPHMTVAVRRFALPALFILVWSLAIAFHFPAIRASFMTLYETKYDIARNNCVWLDELLRPFQQLAHEPAMVLADPDVNLCLIAYAPYAQVMEWRTTNIVLWYIAAGERQEGWDRLFDARYFANAEVVDERLLSIISRWKIKYVIKEVGSPLETELRHLPGMFQPLYAAQGRRVYQVISSDPAGAIVKANSLLQERKWPDAIRAFEKLEAADDPNIRYLAMTGLGTAYRQMGRLADAIGTWSEAAATSKDALPLRLAGEVYAIRGETEPALAAMRQAVTREPENVGLQVRLANLYYVAGRVPEAESTYISALSYYVRPNTVLYYKLLGSAWSNVGEYDRAADTFKRGAVIADDKELYVLLGQAYLRAGRFREAEDLFSQMQARDPWDAFVHLGRGQLETLRGDWTGASAEYRQALRLDGLALGAYDALTAIAQSQRGIPAAIQELESMPGYRLLGFGDALVPMARLQAEMGDYQESNRILEQAVAWDGFQPSYFKLQADNALADGDLGEADRLYSKMLDMDSNSASAYLGLAKVAASRSQTQAEEGFIIRAIQAAPFDASANLKLADWYTDRGLPDLAQQQYQITLAKAADAPGAWISAGQYHQTRGEFALALENYDKALAINPRESSAYVALSLLYRDQGDLERATQTIKQAIQMEPGLAKLHTTLASIYVQQAKPEEAEQELKRAIDLAPGDAAAYFALALLYTQQAEPAQAELVLENLREARPTFIGSYIGLGLLAERQADFDTADALYRTAIASTAPGLSGPALLALADLQARQGHDDQSLLNLQAAVELQPNLAAGYAALAASYARRGDYAQATAVLHRGLSLFPGSAPLNSALSELELAQGMTDQAKTTWRDLFALSPGAIGAAINRADVSAELGEPDEGLALIIPLQQEWSGAGELLGERAALEITDGQPQAAVKSANALVTLDPGHARSWITLGRAYMALGQFENAEQAFRQGTAAEPGDVDAWLELGEFLASRDETNSGITAFQKAIELDQSQARGHLDLAELYDRAGRLPEAIAEYQAAAQLDQRDNSALLALASIYARTGQREKEQQYLEQAAAKPIVDPKTFAARSDFYLRMGQTSQARVILEQGTHKIPGACLLFEKLGNFLAVQGEWATAERNYRQALALTGCPADAHVGLGSLDLLQGRAADAISEYRKAVAARPADPLGYLVLAQLYAHQNRGDDANAMYAEAASRVPVSDLLAVVNGNYRIERGKSRDGLELLLQAAAWDPTDARSLIALGRAFLSLGQYSNAEAIFLRASKVDQRLSGPYLSLGQLYAREGRFAEALAADRRAIEISPGVPAVYNQLGAFLESRGEYEQAVAAYQHGSELDQSQIESRLALGKLYQKLGRFQEAEDTFQDALAVSNANTTGTDDPAVFDSELQAPRAAEVLVALGQLYQMEAKLEQAEEVYKNAIKLAPLSPDAYVQLGKYYQRQGRPQDALAQFNAAIQIAPASAPAYTAQGEFFESQFDWSDAEQAYRNAMRVAPADADGYIHLGKLYQAQGQSSEAQVQFVRATAAAPGSEAAYLALGDWQRFIANWDEAEKAYKQAIALSPAEPEGYLSLSALYQIRARLTEALDQAQLATRLAPASAPAWVALGDLYLSRANPTAAEQAYKQAIAASPSDARGYIRLAQSYQARAQTEQAVDLYDRAARAAPSSANVQIALGGWYESQLNWDDAEASYKNAIRLSPAGPEGYQGLGRLYIALGRMQLALAQFQTATRMAPASSACYVDLGNWYELQANFTAAEENYRQAIRVAPTDAAGYLRIAELRELQARPDAALSQYDAALKAAPTFAQALIDRAKLLQAQAKWNAAEQGYEQAVSLAPGYAPAHVALGDWNRLKGNFGKAKQDYALATAVSAADPAAYVRLGELQAALADPAAALTYFQSAVSIAPAAPEANIALGTWYQQQADWDAAERAFVQAVSRAPRAVDPYVALVRFYHARGKMDQAESLLKAALERNPANIGLLIFAGDDADGRAKLAPALDLYQRAIELQPGNMETRLAVARGLTNQARFSDAERQLQETIVLFPGRPAPYAALGDFYSRIQSWQPAESAYRRALRLEPVNQSALAAFIKTELMQGKFEVGVKQAESWTQLAPAGEVAAWIALGEAKRANGDFAGSVAAYQTANRVMPGFIDGYIGLARTLSAEGQFEAGLATLDRALDLTPNSAPALVSRGVTLEVLGQIAGAQDSYQQASLMDKSYAQAWGALAQLLVAEDQSQQGVKMYREAIAAQPTSFEPYFELGNLYAEMQDIDSALATAKEARRAAPTVLDAYLELARAYSKKGEPSAALSTLQEALSLFVNSRGLVLTRMGDVYVEAEDVEEAKRMYHEAEQSQPDLAEPYLAEGDLYQYLVQDVDKAIALYQQALSIDGKDMVAYAKLFGAYASQTTRGPSHKQTIACPNAAGGDAPGEECKREIRAAVETKMEQGCPEVTVSAGPLDPTNGKSSGPWSVSIGCVYWTSLLDSKMQTGYEAAAAAQPNSIKAQTALAMFYQAFHLYDQEIAVWHRILELAPANQEARFILSEVYSLKESGRHASAGWMGQAMALGIDTQEAHSRLVTLFHDHFSTPSAGSRVSGSLVLTGTADGRNSGSAIPFSFYKVEVGVGSNPTDWCVINLSHTPVSEGVLATWDTSGLPKGDYSLRLVVVDQSGNYRPWDRITVRVE